MEADGTEDAAPADRRLQDDHLAMDAAAGLQPRMLDAALDPDYRTRAAAPPDQLVIPRVRGSLADERAVILDRGSIPACAGKPRRWAGARPLRWVHPRVCGEALACTVAELRGTGPSPRVRGSLVRAE